MVYFILQESLLYLTIRKKGTRIQDTDFLQRFPVGFSESVS